MQSNVRPQGDSRESAICSNLVLNWPLTTGHCPMDRIAALNDVLTQNPNDTFARYGLAMEYSKQGDLDRSLAEFSILLKASPDYTPGYFMAAQTLARAARIAHPKPMITNGSASAPCTATLHAQSALDAVLAER